jgi:hypothetical protein
VSYAINSAKTGWRAINSVDDLMEGEVFSESQPVLTPDLADLIFQAKGKVRSLRLTVFATLAGLQSQALANGDITTAKAISGLQDMLKALPDTDLSMCTEQSDIDVVFRGAWASIVATAPESVVSAFNEVLS